MLRLRLNDRSLIAVNIDGRYFNKGTTSLTLDGLPAGLHRVEVYRVSSYSGRNTRIYTGTVRLNRETVHTAIIDVDRRSMRLYAESIEESSDEEYIKGNRPGERYNRDGSAGGNQSDSNSPIKDNRNERDNGDNREGYGSYPRGRADQRNTSGTFSQRNMDDLRSRVKSLITDIDKDSLLRDKLQSASLTSAQVREMLSWLSFESTRLDFSKWAYNRVIDPANYHQLEEVFTFSSSKKEFNEAINRR